MADDAAESSICFTWGHYFVGREQAGRACFDGAEKFFEGRRPMITNLMVGLATQGNFTDFAGYLVVQGSSDKIVAMMNEPDFLEFVSQARHCMQNFSVVLCDAGDSRTVERKERYKRTGERIGFLPKPPPKP